MKLIPVAFDSMGVRSMCCFLEGKPSILLDPGVSLAPNRFQLPPHRREIEQLMKKRQLINEYAQKADIITISHWHNDHHTPFINGLYDSVTPEVASSLYKGKRVLAKGIPGLNFMQKERARSFQAHCPATSGDGKAFSFEGMRLTFSSPVPHGNSKNVPVVMVSVEGEKKVLHASDTQALSGLAFIQDERPDLLIMSGPPPYLVTPQDMEKAKANLSEVLDVCGELILDHHLVRDQSFKNALPDIWKSRKVKTAAEYAGQENLLLEARRKELYSQRL